MNFYFFTWLARYSNAVTHTGLLLVGLLIIFCFKDRTGDYFLITEFAV